MSIEIDRAVDYLPLRDWVDQFFDCNCFLIFFAILSNSRTGAKPVIQTISERCYILCSSMQLFQFSKRNRNTFLHTSLQRKSGFAIQIFQLLSHLVDPWLTCLNMSQSALKQPTPKLVSDARNLATTWVAACLNIPTTLADCKELCVAKSLILVHVIIHAASNLLRHKILSTFCASWSGNATSSAS